jgi:hypothetical protein
MRLVSVWLIALLNYYSLASLGFILSSEYYSEGERVILIIIVIKICGTFCYNTLSVCMELYPTPLQVAMKTEVGTKFVSPVSDLISFMHRSRIQASEVSLK